MLPKLRLNMTDKFEKLVGVREISDMLVRFVQGKEHPSGIGAEQGGIEKWDDFVIEKDRKRITHIQIKRQTGRFGNALDECERNRKSGSVELRDLSELDKAIKFLGEWIKNKKENDKYDRNFCLVLYEGGIEIKKDFKVRDLVNILETHIRPNTLTPEGLQQLAIQDGPMKKCDPWLRSWCGIKSYEQMLTLLNILKIEYSNTEFVLEAETKKKLKNIFKDSSVNDVHDKIVTYTSKNSTFTGAIKPRHLLLVLKDHLHPDIPRWTQFQTDGTTWNISGIHDLEDNNKIERPSVVVPKLWRTDNKYARKLIINGTCVDNCRISESLMRLSLHLQGSFNIHCSDKSSWMHQIKNKTGGTLGKSKKDFDDERMIDGADSFTSSQSKRFALTDERESLAKELHDEMYKKTFQLLDKKINSKFREMDPSDLRTKVESRWCLWKPSLGSNVADQRELFSKMLRPVAEGDSILGDLRVGSKTVGLLTDALFLLLVVSVCLSCDKTENNWKYVKDKMEMTSIGLAYWSGPAIGLKKGKVMQIDDNKGISKLLEYESGKIIIISQSGLTDTEAFDDDISGEINKIGLLTHPNYPMLLVTQDRRFKKKLELGNIEKLRTYFQEKLNIYNGIIEKAIEEVV